MLIKGTALIWYDDREYELAEGRVVFVPGECRTLTGSRPRRRTC
jgi:hypothetical protein